MNKKKIIAAAAIGAAGIGTGILVKKCKNKKKYVEVEKLLADEEDADPALSRKEIQNALELLFSQYDEEDLALAIWCDPEAMKSSVVKDAVVEYTEDIYRYMKDHMRMPDSFEGRRNDGDDVMYLSTELFCDAGICICSQNEEIYYDRFDLSNDIELWLLENGELAQVRCITYEGSEGTVEYRYLEFYLSENQECHFDVETLCDGLNSIFSESEF